MNNVLDNIKINETTTINYLELVEVIKKNYTSCQTCFTKVQSSFLSGMYKRYYKDLESANIAMAFAINFHRSVLHQRDYDFDFDISYSNFWNNMENIVQKKTKVIDVANETGLARETARRKVNYLIKQNVLHKTKSNIYWKPPTNHIKSFEKIVEDQINGLSKIINEISFYLQLNINNNVIKEEIKSNFSFYWYHYLSCFSQCNKYWQSKTGDIDSLFIILQYVTCSLNYLKKNNIIERKDVFSKRLLAKFNFSNASISSTSISNLTSLPRATCIRKLNKLAKLKVLEKDNNTKKFYLNLDNVGNSNFSFFKEVDEFSIKVFSKFYLILIKALLRSRKN